MKKHVLTFVIGLISCGTSFAQATAQDWTLTDCSGNSHHLFNVLDSGKCVILAYDMLPTCQLCIDAANLLEPIVNAKRTAHPDSVRFYCLGYTGTYSCTTMQNWETAQGFDHDALFTQGTNVSYYGGMGMPTIVVLGKNTHHVYWKKLGIAPSDVTPFTNAIDAVFAAAPTGISETIDASSFNLFPNPASSNLNIQYNNPKEINISLQIVGLNGQVIQEIYSGNTSAGLFEKSVNTSSIATGMYFLKVTSNGVSSYSKINIVN